MRDELALIYDAKRVYMRGESFGGEFSYGGTRRIGEFDPP
jgi:hypothetical protein